MVDPAAKAKAEKRSVINITAPCRGEHHYSKSISEANGGRNIRNRDTDPERLVDQADLENKRLMLDTIDRHVQCLSLSSTSTGYE